MFEEIQQWQMQRLGKVTASEMYKLLQSGKSKSEYFGKGALSYIDEKIAELITGLPSKDLSGLYSIEWGNANEYDGLILLKERLNIDLEIFGGSNNKFVPFNDYSGGSPDAESIELVAELKCPINPAIHVSNLVASLKDYSNDWMKKFRHEYYVQLQFNMMCCKKEKGIFSSFDPRPIDPNHRIAILHISPDEEIQGEIKDRITKAAEIISSTLDILYGNRSVIIAHHDKEAGATIIE